MELWPLRLSSSRLSSACPGTQRGRMEKVGVDRFLSSHTNIYVYMCIGVIGFLGEATVVRPG